MKARQKNPPATDLQLDYIFNSRKQQREQQRRITLSIGVLLVMAVIAAVFAVFQAHTASINAEVSQSNALASAAQQPGNEEIAVALALEASRSKYAPESVFKTLAHVLYPPGGIRYLFKADIDFFYDFLSPAISPDGQHIVIEDQLFDMATGEMLRKFENAPAMPLTGMFLPDGRHVILAGDKVDDSSINPVYLAIYDVDTGQLAQSFDTGIGIYDIQLGTDSKTLVAYQPDGKISLWDIKTGKKSRELDANAYFASVYSVNLSPDLRWLAGIGPSDDGVSALFLANAESGQVRSFEIGTLESGIPPCRFSHDSKQIAVLINGLKLFSVDTGQVTNKISEAPYTPYGTGTVRFSPDDNLLLVASIDQTVTIWNVNTGKVIEKQTAHHSPLIFADFTQKGDRVVSMDGSGVVITWDAVPGNLDRQLATNEKIAAVSTDGRYLIFEGSSSTGSIDHLTIRDTQTLEAVSYLPIVEDSQKVNDGSSFHYYLAEDLEKGLFSYITTSTTSSNTSIINIASLKNGRILHKFSVPIGMRFVETLISPTGDEIYIYNRSNNNLGTWNIAAGDRTFSYGTPTSFIISPSGTQVLLVTDVKYNHGVPALISLQMMNTSNKTVQYSLLDIKPVERIFFTPDGKKFVFVRGGEASDMKSTITVYDTGTGNQVKEYNIDTHPWASHFTVQPDGRTFMALSSVIQIGGNIPEPTLSGISLPIPVSGTYNDSFTQWNLATGELIWEFPIDEDLFPESPGQIQDFVFSPENKHLFSTIDGSLKVWRFDSHDELVIWACANRYVPEFSLQQRELFSIKNESSRCKSPQD